MDDKKIELVFRLWSDETGVFFTKKSYERLRAIDAALASADTWRDFERMCPAGEFDDLGVWWSNGDEYIYEIDGQYRYIDPSDLDEFWRTCGRDRVISADQAFDRDKIPGGGDGDYPSWASMSADDILPDEFEEAFADGGGGGPASGGSWVEYPVCEIHEMVKWLAERGFSVTPHLSYD